MSGFSIANLESLNYKVPQKKFDSFPELQNEATKLALTKVKNLVNSITSVAEGTAIIAIPEKHIIALDSEAVKQALKNPKGREFLKKTGVSPDLEVAYIAKSKMLTTVLAMHLIHNEQFIEKSYEESSKEVKAFYNNILNGVGFVLYPHSSIAESMKIFSSKELVEKISAMEVISSERRLLLTQSLILKTIVLKISQIYSKIAVQSFPDIFNDISDKNPNWKWNAEKLKALAS